MLHCVHRQGPGRINTTAGSVVFNTANMAVNKSYEVKVVVVKGARRSTARVVVEVVHGAPPSVGIR